MALCSGFTNQLRGCVGNSCAGFAPGHAPCGRSTCQLAYPGVISSPDDPTGAASAAGWASITTAPAWPTCCPRCGRPAAHAALAPAAEARQRRTQQLCLLLWLAPSSFCAVPCCHPSHPIHHLPTTHKALQGPYPTPARPHLLQQVLEPASAQLSAAVLTLISTLIARESNPHGLLLLIKELSFARYGLEGQVIAESNRLTGGWEGGWAGGREGGWEGEVLARAYVCLWGGRGRGDWDVARMRAWPGGPSDAGRSRTGSCYQMQMLHQFPRELAPGSGMQLTG